MKTQLHCPKCNSTNVVSYDMTPPSFNEEWLKENKMQYDDEAYLRFKCECGECFDRTLTILPKEDREDAEEITILSSNGQLLIKKSTGEVFDCKMEEDGEGIDQIERFDLEEWRRNYPNEELPDFIDILDLGYWTKDGKYEEPDKEWRSIHDGEETTNDLLK